VWGPVGKLARQNAAGEQVKRAGPALTDGYSRLDRIVHQNATYVANQLRDRHGAVFPVTAESPTTAKSSVICDLVPEVDNQRTSPQEAAAPRSACVALDLKERVTH
jgi:hypothetical protein